MTLHSSFFLSFTLRSLSLFFHQDLPSVKGSCPGRQSDHLLLTPDQAFIMMPSRQQGLLNVMWWQAAHWKPALEQNRTVSAALDACIYNKKKRFTHGIQCTSTVFVAQKSWKTLVLLSGYEKLDVKCLKWGTKWPSYSLAVLHKKQRFVLHNPLCRALVCT